MRSNLLARAGMRIADFCERWFPDAFVFALAAILIVFVGGLSIGVAPKTLVVEFGGGFWSLVNFTMQMALVIIGGFVVASSPPIARMTNALASVPKSGRGAVAFVAAFAMLTSLVSWGLSLIFTGLLVREITRRIPRVDYRAIGAAAYLGLGSVWALGLSSSAALLQATKSSIPASLLPITGVIPLTQTIFLWQSIVLALVLVLVSVAIAYSPRRATKTREPPNRWEWYSSRWRWKRHRRECLCHTVPASARRTARSSVSSWRCSCSHISCFRFARRAAGPRSISTTSI